ncbi:MAG TPA: CNNM domain-containing protein, partial [Accumulibacter sp.]|nr:CNNM domain-containing protein [Accumulibacter sp.]
MVMPFTAAFLLDDEDAFYRNAVAGAVWRVSGWRVARRNKGVAPGLPQDSGMIPEEAPKRRRSRINGVLFARSGDNTEKQGQKGRKCAVLALARGAGRSLRSVVACGRWSFSIAANTGGFCMEQMTIYLNLVLILVFIAGNAFFVGSEIAISSARRSRIKQLSEMGDKRAARVEML